MFPWLISHAALWERNRRRDDGCAAPRALGRVVVALIHHPEKGGPYRISRAEVRDALLYDEGETPQATGTPAPK
ncbi:MAG: hypothetical protein ACU0B1_08210 [Thermohalobaculum sp.]